MLICVFYGVTQERLEQISPKDFEQRYRNNNPKIDHEISFGREILKS